MTTELAALLKKILDDGESLRGIARKVGVSNSTIRRVVLGENVDPSTLDKIADFLKLPADTVYRMAGILPEDNEFTPTQLKIIEIFDRLPEADQAAIIDMMATLLERRNAQRRDD